VGILRGRSKHKKQLFGLGGGGGEYRKRMVREPLTTKKGIREMVSKEKGRNRGEE